jgi:hypothetical protein
MQIGPIYLTKNIGGQNSLGQKTRFFFLLLYFLPGQQHDRGGIMGQYLSSKCAAFLIQSILEFLPASIRSIPPGIHFALLLLVLLVLLGL